MPQIRMHSDYEHLLAKLDAFIRKFYKDRLIRGGLYSVGLLVGVFLLATLLESLGHFGIAARTALFWGALGCMAVVLGRFIALPLMRLFRLGSTISHEEAARIVGVHFHDVQDRLLNTLQLRGMASAQPAQRELIEAAIAQRSRELGPVPFVNAIDLRRNTRYLRFALPPLLALLVMLIAAPSLITAPAKRILAHDREFIPEAPFRFTVLNDTMRVLEEQDFELLVELQGEAIPQQVDLVMGEQRIPLVKQSGIRFMHRFRNVREALNFHFVAEGFRSSEYTLSTVPNPLVLDFDMSLEYPAYLSMPNEVRRNTGDITVPAGTRIIWTVNARSADRMRLAFDDTVFAAASSGTADNRSSFRFTRRFMESHAYQLSPSKGAHSASETVRHRVEVTPDLYPTIAVGSRSDSTALKRLFYSGEVGDDHGFRRLIFHYRFVEGGDSIPEGLRAGSYELSIDPRNTQQRFFHSWDLYDLTVVPGDRIEHWFEVWDNDGANGSKSTRSAPEIFAAPSLKELAEKQEANSEAIKSELRESIREAQDLQRELDKMRRDLMERKELGWQEKQRLEDIMQRQQKLEERIERNNEQLRMSQQEQREFSPQDERLLEKQQQVQELFENVLSEEMKELYRQMQELMENIDKEQLQEQLREMKLDQEDVEKELDRALEMFKRMEVEQQAEDITKQLEELAERQESLSEETKEGRTPEEAVKEKQEELNKEFEELRKRMDELQEKNGALEQPMEIPDTDQQEQEIQDQQQQSSEQLDKNQRQKAGGSQKGAAEKMEQLALQMKNAMEGGAQEQQEEDMDALRQLLENIVQLSFDEESLLSEVGTTNVKDPRWIGLGRTQRKLRDDARVIEDSLFALSKRIPQLESIVNREMNAVNDNMDEATRMIGEARANDRMKPAASDKQQHAMTSLNNLALLLDEALQQMMQQMNAQSKPGSGSCNKPGGKGSGKGKKPSMSRMRAQQEALQKQLEEMRKAQQEGGKKGEKPGQQNPGSMGLPGMGQQLAQLAAQQAAIRKEMQRMAQEMNKDGSGAGNGLNKLAEEMEKQERDIVNRRISPETVRRQQDIMTRLLEHEKAERERELEQQRTSNEGRDQPASDPARYFDQERRKARETELLRTVPPGLKPYYRDRVNTYFGTFDRP